MEIQRKKYITNTEVEINYLQASKRADEEVLENLLHQTDCPYIQHQIQQITAKNIQRHETIQELTQKLQDLHEGKLDNEIKAEIILSTQQHENAEGAAKDKKIELKNRRINKEHQQRNFGGSQKCFCSQKYYQITFA